MTIDPKKLLIFFVGIPLALFCVILVLFFILKKKNQNKKSAVLQKMMAQNSATTKSSDVFYQNIYVKLDGLPIVNRYLRKIRRRLEIINEDDEYSIRKSSAKIALKAIIVALLSSIVLAWINKADIFMMILSLLGVVIFIENLTEQMINKVENRLLEQQLEFFSEVRHAFHETSMVEEAIYDASLFDDGQEVISQANRIYDIMISADPEIELEKYYDVAPNKFLKIFAGVSYLTKEFGDRKVNGISLYLKDMNNITQELQLEILKRDKLDYMFQSLTYIAIAPIVLIHPLKNWALDSFASTGSFYEGKVGFICEILLMVLIFVSYSLLVRIKDNMDNIKTFSTNEAWQERIYRLPVVEKIVDALVPNPDKPSYVRINKLLKDTASTLKLEWLYVNRIIYAVVAFGISLLLISKMHSIAIENVLYGDSIEGNIMGQASAVDILESKTISASDRYFVNSLMESDEIVRSVRYDSGDVAISKIRHQLQIISSSPLSEDYAEKLANKVFRNMNSKRSKSVLGGAEIQSAILKSGIEMPRIDFVDELKNTIIQIARDNNRTEIIKEDVIEAVKVIYSVELSYDQISIISERIYGKLKALLNEYFLWTELLISMMIGVVAFQIPKILLFFQKKMRQLEMDDEVMQFQTIILMLMHIERMSVESILEWITRFSNIFREPLQRCLNNYESGAYEALEVLKDETTFKPFIRIVESLQSAVENVKISDAFDELESERAFFQEKRKEANERLILKKARIGKVIGFAPMVTLFVGYLIIPLIWTSVMDMGSYFQQMGSML